MRRDQRDGFATIRGFAHDLDIGLFGQQATKALTRERLVVDDENGKSRHGVVRRNTGATTGCDSGVPDAARRVSAPAAVAGAGSGTVYVAGGPSSVSNGITTDAIVPLPSAGVSVNSWRLAPYR